MKRFRVTGFARITLDGTISFSATGDSAESIQAAIDKCSDLPIEAAIRAAALRLPEQPGSMEFDLVSIKEETP